MATQNPSQPRAYSQAYLPNGNPAGTPGAQPLLPNQGRMVQAGGARVLCIADVRGNLRSLNELARSARADYIIHTGDFGFYDDTSLGRIAEKTLKHVAQYSPLLSDHLKNDIARAPPQPTIKERFQRESLPLSELPLFLNGSFKLEVPVYTVWGACEDVSVLEKLRSGEYKIDSLHVIDEAHSRLLDVGGVKLRLLGLGGAVVMHKLFDNGEGRTTIAGGQGTMWTTLLQMGELVDTANRVYDPTETRIFVTHASPTREGILNQLSVTLKADFSISAGLHFRYGSSYNEFSVNPTLDHYRGKLAASKASFNDVWETVQHEVEPAVSDNESQQRLLSYALEVIHKMPSVANGGNPFGGGPGGPQAGQVDESAFKNMWNFNLADAAFGWLVLDVDQGRIGTEMRAQGFNFSHRGTKAVQRPGAAQAPATSTATPTGSSLPAPSAQPMPTQQRASQPPASQSAVVSSSPAPAPAGQQTQTARQTPQHAQQAPPSASKPTSTPQTSAAPNGHSPAVAPGANGSAATVEDKSAESPKPEAKPSQAIYIPSLHGLDDDQMKDQIFSEDDRSKIAKIERTQKGFWIAYFNSPEEMQEVLQRSPKEGKYSSLKLSEFRTWGGRGGFAGSWGSTRGGAGAPHHGTSHQTVGGYRSGGASDSEGGRGGRGGRGSYRSRGDRGRGRGGRGGSSEKPDGGASSGPAASGGDA